HDARADALELHDAPLAGLSAIEADVVRTKAGRQRGGPQHLGVELADLHPQRARLVVPVEGHVALDLLEAGAAGFDGRWRPPGSLAAAAALGERPGAGERECYRKKCCAHVADSTGSPDPGSLIADPESLIRNPQSGIPNPVSLIVDPG